MIKTSDIINRRRHVASLWRIFENSTTVNSSNSNPNHLIHVSQKRNYQVSFKRKVRDYLFIPFSGMGGYEEGGVIYQQHINSRNPT